ncbi:hypothetical protein [Pseudoalteromonas phenolica]|uniref:Uncharacterized protein n=1 Tax=Pseudoalteromonas phenolica TaxID=161398 RepID=A0A0S2K7X5_9GAMM|nr:hypothetical protein [Pseudoalteromonas phenolica]ALO44427.1 hypothetical protein PP2015_3959 [Pseudoalteromonas phenolica]MBE0357441.1 hypothetical protein [Pseudoalteromonas phenolica O-BC30]
MVEKSNKNSDEIVPYPETLAQAVEFVIQYHQYAVQSPYLKED